MAGAWPLVPRPLTPQTHCRMSTLTAALPCPSVVTPELRAQYERDGYLALSGLLDPTELQAARDDLRRLIWEHREGDSYSRQVEPGVDITGLDPAALELKVRKIMSFDKASPYMEHLCYRQGRLHGLLTGLLGPGYHLFQSMALIKPPKIGSEKPWHQDTAYFRATPMREVIGVWIALDEALPENGCMHVLPGWHQRGPLAHIHGPVAVPDPERPGQNRTSSHQDCQITPNRLDLSQAIPVPLPAGGVLIFNGLLPHQTPPNHSQQRRRALQFHYRAASTENITPEAFLKVFAEADGTPAGCHAAGLRAKGQLPPLK
jgi:phytanoyl-CoA hydroxylase